LVRLGAPDTDDEAVVTELNVFDIEGYQLGPPERPRPAQRRPGRVAWSRAEKIGRPLSAGCVPEGHKMVNMQYKTGTRRVGNHWDDYGSHVHRGFVGLSVCR
jgi:hypothetical protein